MEIAPTRAPSRSWHNIQISLIFRYYLIAPVSPSELPLALPLPPPETPFTKFVQKNIVAVRYLATVFPAHISERAQSIAVVMVGQKFNWKPSIGTALTDASRTLERSQ
jgi:hypothetical protein